MSAQPSSRHSELQIVLEPSHSELVRAFIREASLAEGVQHFAAGQIAEDALETWLALCAHGSGGARVHVALLSSRKEVSARILLQGHHRFSNLLPTLSGRLRREAGLSYRERGIDGWEISLHRSLHEEAELAHFADETATGDAPPTTGPFRIEPPKESDTAAIARCFLEVYGHNYIHSEVFSPHRYWAKVESGELVPMIARNDRGEVVGHVALEREPGACIAERGEAVVLPAYRGHHLLELMTGRLSEEAPKIGLQGIFAEPVTVHIFSQRNDERAGMPVCAVLLGAAPENMRPKGLAAPTAGQRQSLLLAFRFLQPPAPRVIHAPAPYREAILKIYESLGVSATIAEPAAPMRAESRASVKADGRGYGEIHFQSIGENAAIELKQALNDVVGLGASAIRLSAPVGDPGLPILTAAARKNGFFFSGLGPAFADGADTLLLQRLSEPLDTGKLQIFSDRAKELVAFIDRDRAAVGQAG
ncbi:hypothetical protein [Methylocystis sp. ATCC 49242]|uniref:hypothetical protein n=1 Tax=Methylocystis sp. ATCC 49242 TaxID=622637 RepID=UPI0001F86861|nr:hypothetical protein [Methylocystis sp. ATCC 49242]